MNICLDDAKVDNLNYCIIGVLHQMAAGGKPGEEKSLEAMPLKCQKIPFLTRPPEVQIVSQFRIFCRGATQNSGALQHSLCLHSNFIKLKTFPGGGG